MQSDSEGWRFEVASTWNGTPLSRGEVTYVSVSANGIVVDAPFYDDARPSGPGGPVGIGRHDRLWEHEVVEVFLAEGDEPTSRYVELELGPHGHWLVLGFEGYRRAMMLPDGVVVDYRASLHLGDVNRWRGELVLEPRWWQGVLAATRRANAFAIHDGTSAGITQRRFCAAFPAPNEAERPDFHRVDWFGGVISAA